MERSRRCSACGAELTLEAEQLPLGGDGWGLVTIGLTENLTADAYVCPACGKIELYTSEPALPEPGETETCPVCGTVHSTSIACPTCLMDRVAGGAVPQPEPGERPARRKKDGKKPPWEF